MGEDRDQFGRVAAPRVVDSDVGVFDGPAGRHDVPGWHGQRLARIAVEGREIGPAALLDGAQFVAGLPPQAESVRDLASRIAQARERRPIAPLGLQAVVRRLCETTSGAGSCIGGLSCAPKSSVSSATYRRGICTAVVRISLQDD